MSSTATPSNSPDFETVIEGMEDDLYPVRNQTWDELRSYCYKVASAVGLILIEIYGYDDRAARLHAIDLGIQMQLINVLRDINEDMERGRIYLPLDVLASHDITLEMLENEAIAETQRGRASSWNTSTLSSDIKTRPTISSATSTVEPEFSPRSWQTPTRPSCTKSCAAPATCSRNL